MAFFNGSFESVELTLSDKKMGQCSRDECDYAMDIGDVDKQILSFDRLVLQFIELRVCAYKSGNRTNRINRFLRTGYGPRRVVQAGVIYHDIFAQSSMGMDSVANTRLIAR